MNKKCLLSIIVIFLLISRSVLIQKSGNKMEIQKKSRTRELCQE